MCQQKNFERSIFIEDMDYDKVVSFFMTPCSLTFDVV